MQRKISCDRLNILGLFDLERGSLETVSKLAWGGLSALDALFRFNPVALPRADIDRAFGPLMLWFRNNLSARRDAVPAWAKPQDWSLVYPSQ
jgi:hypothetical protein